MRIVSYNILDGGEGRADPLAEVVEANRPDIVCLIEADNPDVVARMAKRLNFDSITGWGEKHAVAILSRWPIVESINHAGVRGRPRCLLEATIRAGNVDWIIGALHFKGGAGEADEAIRNGEVAETLSRFERHRKARRPHLLAGDFNANAPSQLIDPAKCTSRTAEQFAANGNILPRRVIKSLLDAGYVDTLSAYALRAAETIGTFTTQHPGQRIDYIFAHGIEPGRIVEARVEQDRLAKYASDHFPVVAEIR